MKDSQKAVRIERLLQMFCAVYGNGIELELGTSPIAGDGARRCVLSRSFCTTASA